MPPRHALLGSNRIEAYVVDDDGNIVRAGRTHFARNDAALDVKLDHRQAQYDPGSPRSSTFSVIDENGDARGRGARRAGRR